MATVARWDRRFVIGIGAAMGAVALASSAMAATVAAGHAYFHLLFGLFGVIPASILAAQPMPARWRSIAIVGLGLMSITQIVEAVGAWGFGPDNDTVVSPIKALHDLGVVISPIGLVGAVLGVSLAIVVALRSRGKSMIALGAAAGVAVVGLFVVAKMIGF